MSKKQEFIEFINTVFNEANITLNNMPDGVRLYWETFCETQESEKPILTDNGKLILQFLKDNQNTQKWKSKDIAEELFIPSRSVSGAIRKLVTDGFVEKIGQDPAIYILTEKGKNFEIN